MTNNLLTASSLARVSAADSVLAARLFARSGRRRGSLAGCMIAATVIRLDAEFATIDLDDFRRFRAVGLRLDKNGRHAGQPER